MHRNYFPIHMPNQPYGENRHYQKMILRIGDRIIHTTRPIVKKKKSHRVIHKIMTLHGEVYSR